MKKRNLIVIPYGTPNWGILSENMKEVLNSLIDSTDVVYLLPLWGLVYAKDFHPSMLSGFASMNEREITKQTGLMIRSWLLHQGIMYDKIALLNYGNTMSFWNVGAIKTPIVKKVTIIRYLPSKVAIIKKITRTLNEDRTKNISLTAKEKANRLISKRGDKTS